MRFEVTFGVLAPDLKIVAPIRDAGSRARRRWASRRNGVSRSPGSSSTYSIDENMWGRTAECGPLEDPWVAPPEDAFERTTPPAERPIEPAEIDLTFERGVPVAWMAPGPRSRT